MITANKPGKTKKIIKAIESFIIEPQSSGAKLKILMVGAEAHPYASAGGVAMVMSYLSKELTNLGHDVRVFIPKYGSIDEKKYGLKMVYEGLEVPTDDPHGEKLICNVKTSNINGVQTYFLENQEYYELRANIYGYSDDPTRWALLSRGVLEFIRAKEFVPDIIHCNDWQTGIVPNYLKTTYADDVQLQKIATLFTIHNLAIQGITDMQNASEMDFDDGKSLLVSFFDERLAKQNFMKRGIIYADALSAVSKTYSKEILSREHGCGLDKLLEELRSKLFGIVNGIDYEQMNPATDSLIEKNYDANTLSLRADNKRALQQEFDLAVNKNALLLGFVGRLDWQKGVDLIVETLRHVLKDFDVQFVQVGGGEIGLVDSLRQLQNDFPDKVAAHSHTNFTLSRLLFAGCDGILLPSRFEPCGIVQLEAMRYGAIPIARSVGGLNDTVIDFDAATREGTGFVFKDVDCFSLFGQIVRAVELYKNKPIWRRLQKNAMKSDFSWGYSAKEYERLYNKALVFHGVKKLPS